MKVYVICELFVVGYANCDLRFLVRFEIVYLEKGVLYAGTIQSFSSHA